jgi:hypothetical protein
MVPVHGSSTGSQRGSLSAIAESTRLRAHNDPHIHFPIYGEAGPTGSNRSQAGKRFNSAQGQASRLGSRASVVVARRNVPNSGVSRIVCAGFRVLVTFNLPQAGQRRGTGDHVDRFKAVT